MGIKWVSNELSNSPHKFFRNLLMGENHELKNRYMLVNAPSEWSDGTSTEQVPNKYRTSPPLPESPRTRECLWVANNFGQNICCLFYNRYF